MKKTVERTGIWTLSIVSSVAFGLNSATPAEAATHHPKPGAIYMNGQLATKPYGIVAHNTTYMPIWYVMQALNKLGIHNTWDGTTWAMQTPDYLPVDLTNAKVGRAAKSISLDGKVMTRVDSIVYTDPASNNLTTYMPIWYIQQLLNRLGVGSGWDGRNWTLTTPPSISTTVADPSQYPTLHFGNDGYQVVLLQQKLNAAGYNVGSIDGRFETMTQVAVESLQSSVGIPPDGAVGQQTWLSLNQRLATIYIQPGDAAQPQTSETPTSAVNKPKVIQAWATDGYSLTDAEGKTGITRINNDNYNINTDGTVTDSSYGDSLPANLTGYGARHNVEVFATITNISPATRSFDGTYTGTVLNNDVTRTGLEKNLVNVTVREGYEGIDLDVENVKPTDRVIFTQFLTELAGQLHASGKKLSVTVPAKTGPDAEPWDGAYDYAAIGKIADVVPIMAYDFSWAGTQPGAIAPLYWDNQILSYATQVMPADKILLGLPAYGYDWNTSSGAPATAYSLGRIDTLISQYNVTPKWDSTDSAPYFTYTDDSGGQHTVYYENGASILQKLNDANQYGIAGVTFWKAGLENPSFWIPVQSWIAPCPTS